MLKGQTIFTQSMCLSKSRHGNEKVNKKEQRKNWFRRGNDTSWKESVRSSEHRTKKL